MAGTNKIAALQLFGKISAFSTVTQIKKYIGGLQNLSPYTKEYESTLDLILDILRTRGYTEQRLVREIIEMVTGDANIGAAIEMGYHSSINSLEGKLARISTKDENEGFIPRLEDAVKVTISSILTGFLTCSISPFIPYSALDKVYKGKQAPGEITLTPINIPTHILDFSNTLHVSPVSESGIYFYNTENKIKYYRRDEGKEEKTTATIADIKDKNAEAYKIYTYNSLNDEEYASLPDEDRKEFKKVVSVPRSVKVKLDEKPPAPYIYTIRPNLTTEGLYKTDDMNAFIWYVANRGDNFDETRESQPEEYTSIMYEYNKMAWDSRRLNNREGEEKNRRSSDAENWQKWLMSRTSWDTEVQPETSDLKFINKDGQLVESLYPILQFEPSESYGHMEHLIVTFPAQRYYTEKTIPAIKIGGEVIKEAEKLKLTKTIYKFNADYLRSIKLFNWKTIIMNMLYELNGVSPIPDIQFNLSLSDEIIDARLSTLILDTITADDKEVDDSYYSFSNEEYSEALKRMELKKYSAKAYDTASSSAIQNESMSLDIMDTVSNAATLNEITSTITRGVYSVQGTSGSTGITKTTLSYDLAYESNFVQNLLMAIVKPFIRALLSPQVMLLFCINLDVMGLVNLKDLGKGDFDAVNDFIFRKLSGIIKKLIVQIKDAIVLYLLEIVKKEIKKLIDEVITILLLEQLNDYIRLLTQIMECIQRFGIGKTVTGIDEVNYADIIPEAKAPES